MKQAGMGAAGLLVPRLSLNAFANLEDNRLLQLREALSSRATRLKIPGLAGAVVPNV